MFGKNKVKGHNRVSKGKSGFKVIRVDDFFRKKDENRGKKIALAVGGTGLLLGAGLLAKKKGLKLPSLGKKASDMVVDVKTTKIPDTKLLTSGKKAQNLIEDPWETPILTKIQKESQLVTNKNEGSKLLSPAKIKKPDKERSLLQKPQRKTKNVEGKVIQVSNAQKDYKSLPTEMQTILQVEKALLSPAKKSNLGRPPEKTSIVKLVDGSEGKLDKATRKVKDRLKREKAISDEAVKKN